MSGDEEVLIAKSSEKISENKDTVKGKVRQLEGSENKIFLDTEK
ncbi:MAG: hypothetical protein J07AB43_07150 [Candidatus Nanosalina sp. J07AB43]|nr:MAG: hypothetical protein J07AB43_07150 [Candidatus Nanosalina sp. J07AB43]